MFEARMPSFRLEPTRVGRRRLLTKDRLLHYVFGIIRYHFVVTIFLYSVDFGIKWYRKWRLLYLALPVIRGKIQAVCKWRVFKVSCVFFIFFFGIMWYRSGYCFFVRYKAYFFISYDRGSKLTCDSVFFSRVVSFGRKQRYVGSDSICRWSCITVGSERIIWQAMQDKALSTKRANCLYYRDLRVDKRAFLWTKCPRKF